MFFFFLLALLLWLDVSTDAHLTVTVKCLPLGIFDIERTPQGRPSFAERSAVFDRVNWPADAFVGPWRDRSTWSC